MSSTSSFTTVSPSSSQADSISLSSTSTSTSDVGISTSQVTVASLSSSITPHSSSVEPTGTTSEPTITSSTLDSTFSSTSDVLSPSSTTSIPSTILSLSTLSPTVFSEPTSTFPIVLQIPTSNPLPPPSFTSILDTIPTTFSTSFISFPSSPETTVPAENLPQAALTTASVATALANGSRTTISGSRETGYLTAQNSQGARLSLNKDAVIAVAVSSAFVFFALLIAICFVFRRWKGRRRSQSRDAEDLSWWSPVDDEKTRWNAFLKHTRAGSSQSTLFNGTRSHDSSASGRTSSAMSDGNSLAYGRNVQMGVAVPLESSFRGQIRPASYLPKVGEQWHQPGSPSPHPLRISTPTSEPFRYSPMPRVYRPDSSSNRRSSNLPASIASPTFSNTTQFEFATPNIQSIAVLVDQDRDMFQEVHEHRADRMSVARAPLPQTEHQISQRISIGPPPISAESNYPPTESAPSISAGVIIRRDLEAQQLDEADSASVRSFFSRTSKSTLGNSYNIPSRNVRQTLVAAIQRDLKAAFMLDVPVDASSSYRDSSFLRISPRSSNSTGPSAGG